VQKWRRKVTSFETSIGKQSVGEPPIHRLPPDINLNNWTYACPELSPLEFLHLTTQDARYGGSNLRQNLDFFRYWQHSITCSTVVCQTAANVNQVELTLRPPNVSHLL
jgi:hypothetical protein